MRSYSAYRFDPAEHEENLRGIIAALAPLETVDPKALNRVLKRHPKGGTQIYSKSEIIRGVRHFGSTLDVDARAFIDKLRMKPIRSSSGVAPVTVLTKPFPCPGQCIFCPNDVRMPKSYLAMEPGAQRATQNAFDPFAQTYSRLKAFHINGHRTDKIELIVLGGTWSFYPEAYQVWFIKRCLDAMNAFDGDDRPGRPDVPHEIDFKDLDDTFDGARIERTYNEIVSGHLKHHHDGSLLASTEVARWDELFEAQRANELASSRCVGLVVETRPDHLDDAEVEHIRRLGATKVQIGIQSLDDRVLEMNKRGHDVAATRAAMKRLRQAGFKIHAHWMPNLYGSSPANDRVDFERVFGDADFRPDELKIYPCSLIETAELMRHYDDGTWQPYSHEALVDLIADCMPQVPRYCRTTRVIRDIPSHDIVVGNKLSNLREVAEQAIDVRNATCNDIRAREIRSAAFDPAELTRRETEYETSAGRERFIEYVTPDDRIVGFLRLSLPRAPSFIDELDQAAIIREVHVYGPVVAFGARDAQRSQHTGLGRALVEYACELAQVEGHDRIAVISAIGTRQYYRDLGFTDGPLYQHRALARSSELESLELGDGLQ